MGAKIEKMGKAFTIRWKEKLDSIKVNATQNDPELQKDLQATSNAATSLDLTDQRIVYDVLQRWCEGNPVRKVIEDNEDKIWNKMEKRCFD
ncbi:hypothetical protein A6V39_00215 [Candidatus Mycoplasma haematobovis]|uniref:Uncharacterized protein n=1 Tax=Candidatus Mycoplasma haematobovis TaxID=432608 RepID=A0A1A9QDD3_9MOLU|nr:hypothetical protein [Candidatus Mycoplasma haematobovis]OAL10473.1 hypothetical protein A6V39_00215 [Candidatus Mycoplasma haematobovis]